MKLQNRLKYVIPMIITVFLLCIIYAIKGIYPFGIKTIDYYDMAQQIAAFYYHVFDFLHGEKNLFYDPYTALSVNMAMSTSGCSHISIFNLFFLFVKREKLLESFSYFLMLKMMLMSLFMYIYIHSKYRIEYIYELIFSVGYAFCGYVMMLYMTIHWLDVAALFPLLMLFLHKLLKDGKTKGYIAILTMALIASYYQTFMILIYVVLMVGVAVFTDKVLEKKTDVSGDSHERVYKCYHLVKLFCSTVISVILSMFILIPQIKQTLASARFNNESGGGLLAMYYGIVSTTKPAYTSRWWSLLGLSFAFSVIAYGIIRFRKEKKIILSSILALVIILSELIVEGVNLFWHFGSYVGYPIRNGYMIYFTVAIIACGFIEKLTQKERIEGIEDEAVENNSLGLNKGNVKLVNVISACGSFVSVIVIAVILYAYANTNGLELRNVFHITSAVMAFTFFVYLLIIALKCKRTTVYVSAIIVAELILFGFIMIGKPAYTSANTADPEQEGEYIRICNQLDEKFHLNAVENTKENGESLLFSRIKNPDTTLNSNYGLVLRRPELSNWTHILAPILQRDAEKLGYSVQYTRLLDAGGTAFSDAILGIDTVISRVELNDELYELLDSTEIETDHITHEKAVYYLYKCRYVLPFGLIVNSTDYNFENGDIVSIHNSIYESIVPENVISGDRKLAERIADTDDLTVEAKNNSVIYTKNIEVSGKKAIYYFSNQVDTDDGNTEVSVNGKEVLVPSIGEPDNTLYPGHFNNNAILLGVFKDEAISVEIVASNIAKDGNELEGEVKPEIISIDLDLMSQLVDGYADCVSDRKAYKSGYEFTVDTNSKDGFLLLPFSYDEGYRFSVDGRATENIPVGGLFTAVNISEGDSIVKLEFIPEGMMLGILISALGVILLVAYMTICKKSDVLNKEYNWLNNMYFAMFIAVMIFMYVIPYAFAILALAHIV